MTSLLSMEGNISVLLSSTRVTWAKPTGPRFSVPPKITSSILSPRRLRADCSPMTQQIASEILDLPEPLGPTMAVMLSPKFRTVLSGKDLKPWISSAFRYTGPPLSSQIFSKRCGATASRFSYFSCFLKSWRIFSMNWCKNWCKTGGCFFLHHKNPETVGAVRLRGFERAVCELLRTYAG